MVSAPIVIEFSNFTKCKELQRLQEEEGGRGISLEDHCKNYPFTDHESDQEPSGNNDNALRSLFSRDKKDKSYLDNPAGVGYLGSVEM